MAFLAQKLISASGATEETADADFNLVTSLYHFDGSNGAQNNTFLDSSDSGHSLTRNGNLTQGTFSPFSADEGKWSAQFTRATPDYIQVASSSDFAFGTGDFTIECWCYLTAGQNAYGNGLFAQTTGVVGPALGQWHDDGWQIYVGSSETNLSDTDFPLNEWVHVAYVRASNVTNVYQNGVKVTSDITDNTNYTNTGFNIGWYYGTAYAWDGYISNFRVVKGTAVYTGAFTPPTEPLTAITNTVLLTSCSNRFRDKSTSAHTITPSSSPKIKPFSPFAPSAEYDSAVNGGSGHFDGSGDFLGLPTSNDFDFSGSFTIEAWVYLEDLSTSRTILGTCANYAGRSGIYFGTSGNNLVFFQYITNTTIITSSSSIIKHQWNHVAAVRHGVSITLYINGTSVGNTTFSNSFSGDSAGGGVGGFNTNPGIYYLDGYMSDMRVVNGTAMYTSNFTPPTAPLTKVTNTKLLANFTNAAMFDQTGKTNVETVGNAQLDTSVKKFGTASAEFDGTGDYLAYPLTSFIEFGSSDWTIECFVNVDAVSTTYKCIYSASYGVQFYVYNDLLHLAVNDTDNTSGYMISANSGTGISASTWHHVAAYRLGSAFYCSIDGVVTSMGTSSATIASPSLAPSIGIWGGQSLPMDGYIDEFRITRKARYGSSNFTAPTKAFPNL